jgi:hypothetical protein
MSTAILSAPSRPLGAASDVRQDGPPIGAGAAGDTGAEHRLAALVDELARRDAAAVTAREARRPGVWLAAMTAGAAVLAPLAVVVMVAPPL